MGSPGFFQFRTTFDRKRYQIYLIASFTHAGNIPFPATECVTAILRTNERKSLRHLFFQVFLKEDIESQREMYKYDQEADRTNLKRLLRDSLLRNDVQHQISKLTPEESAALRSAVSLVRASSLSCIGWA